MSIGVAISSTPITKLLVIADSSQDFMIDI